MDVLPNIQLALGTPLTILFTVLRVAAVYSVLLVLLRLSGGRQFGQLTTIDLVTLLFLSNVLQNAMIGPDYSVIGGLLGATTLIVLYRVSVRLPFVQARLESHPVMLVYRVQTLSENLRREGICLSEPEEAAREHGVADLSYVETAVLEMNGAISVIPKEAAGQRDSRGWAQGGKNNPRKPPLSNPERLSNSATAQAAVLRSKHVV